MRKSSLYSSLPLPSIPPELPPSPCSEKVSAFSDIVIYTNTVSGISNNRKSFTTFEIAQMVYFLRDGDKRSAARDGDNDVSGISNDCKSFTMSESTQTVYFLRTRGKYRRSRG